MLSFSTALVLLLAVARAGDVSSAVDPTAEAIAAAIAANKPTLCAAKLVHKQAASETNYFLNVWADYNPKYGNLYSDTEITEETIAKSFVAPETITSARRFDSRLVMIDGNIFVEGYYRENRYGGVTIPFAEFVNKQEWLEWDATARVFKYHPNTNPGLALLNSFAKGQKEVMVYRGLKEHQYKLLLLIRLLRQKSPDPSRLAQLLNAQKALANDYPTLPDLALLLRRSPITANASHALRTEYAQRLLETGFESTSQYSESLFATPDRDRAEGYAKNPRSTLLTAKLNVESLRQMIPKHQLYVGYEFYFYELMFRTPEGAAFLADSIVDEN